MLKNINSKWKFPQRLPQEKHNSTELICDVWIKNCVKCNRKYPENHFKENKCILTIDIVSYNFRYG